MVVMISGSACISATSKLMPASINCGILSITAVIIPSIIKGIAATMAVIISGNAETKDVKS